MLPIRQPVDTTQIPLGQRRGILDVARIGLDLNGGTARAEQRAAPSSWAYPSPPMSGSPPLPTKALRDIGGRSQTSGGYSSTIGKDAYSGPINQPPLIDHRGLPNMPPSLPSLFQQETPERMMYSYQRPEEPLTRPPPYPPAGGPGMVHPPNYLPTGGPGVGGVYSVSSRPPTVENQQVNSPKSQRKTKGHVASACVPCKRAHLRCDAQRPCSRCLTNGKEDSCVDVQHKKRGRPRLRDDRETRYDPSRFPHPQNVPLRRPLSIYPSSGSMGSGDHLASRFSNQASPSDINVHQTPSSMANLPPEPVAFLSMKLEIAKASHTFVDAIGGTNVQGRSLTEIVSPIDRHKLDAIRMQLQESQTKQEPNYLPPILGSLDHILQRLGFSAEEIGRYQPEYTYYLKFEAPEGWREYRVRVGLAKEASIYFVVFLLDVHDPYSWKSPWKSRGLPGDVSRQLGGQSSNTGSTYSPHTPVSIMADQTRQGYSEGVVGPRLPPTSSTQAAVDVSPNDSSRVPSYSASPSHSQYSGPSPSFHIPRSELSPAPRPPAQPFYQLPPIRAQPEQGAPLGMQQWAREDRSGRVDITGLIEKPYSPGRPH